MKCNICGADIPEMSKGMRDICMDGEEIQIPFSYYGCLVKDCPGKIITTEEIEKMKDILPHIYREHVYVKYRGKCKEYCETLIKERPELKMIPGFYYCPISQVEEIHWWCEDKDGLIVDPTAKQFWSEGRGRYRKFEGFYKCRHCGKDVHEKSSDKIGSNRNTYCNDKCYQEFMGCD